MEREAEVIGIIARFSSRSAAQITRDLELAGDLGLDSLDMVQLTLSLEDTFNLRCIEDERMDACTTVGDVVDLVNAQLNGSQQ